MTNLDRKVRSAIRHFWKSRANQMDKQGKASGRKDAGLRSAVTGGKQLDGFVHLCKELLFEAGLNENEIFIKSKLDLPGFFRPEKRWDLLAVADGRLLAVIEFKSQVGPSFGNNFNNRTEESLGNATDLWTAYREGAFKPSARPWLGFMMLVEKAEASTRAVRVKESHYSVFKEFRNTSYLQRYDLLLTKLLRERLYDGSCLLATAAESGVKGDYHEPNSELSFEMFAAGLVAHVSAFTGLR